MLIPVLNCGFVPMNCVLCGKIFSTCLQFMQPVVQLNPFPLLVKPGAL